MNFFLKILSDFPIADLPWRRARDPYSIWVSEIFLQQTQVSRVIPFYQNFLHRFPHLSDLAVADWETFLPYFRGLGFYSRGRNMLQTAKIITEKYNGIFPHEISELRKLPGIGPYTAAAIASFAFGEKVPAIDTNLDRVFSRFFGGEKGNKIAVKAFEKTENSAHLHHALMDIGREICTAKVARCEQCPLAPKCDFLKSGQKEAQEMSSPTGKVGKFIITKPLVEVAAACIRRDEKYLIAKCGAGKNGKWEFVGGKRERGEDWRHAVKREVAEEIGIEVSVRPHFFEEISEGKRLRFFRCQILRGEPRAIEHEELKWISPQDFSEYDFPKTNLKAIARLIKMRK